MLENTGFLLKRRIVVVQEIKHINYLLYHAVSFVSNKILLEYEVG